MARSQTIGLVEARWRVFAVATAQDQNRFITEDWFRRTLDFDAPHRNARDRFDVSFNLKG